MSLQCGIPSETVCSDQGYRPPVVTRHAAASQENRRREPEVLSCRRYDRTTRPGGAWLW